MKRAVTAMAFVLLISALLCLVGCESGSDDGITEKGDGYTIKNEKLFEGTDGKMYLEGNLVVQTGRDIKGVFLQWDFYDAKGNQCGSTVTNFRRDMKDGETIYIVTTYSWSTDAKGKLINDHDENITKTHIESFKLNQRTSEMQFE